MREREGRVIEKRKRERERGEEKEEEGERGSGKEKREERRAREKDGGTHTNLWASQSSRPVMHGHDASVKLLAIITFSVLLSSPILPQHRTTHEIKLATSSPTTGERTGAIRGLIRLSPPL